MTDAQIIPEDIMKAAEEALDNLLCNCSESCGGPGGVRKASIVDIAKAILAERIRCAAVAKEATMMTGAPIQEIGNEVAAAVMSQPKAVKFWMVYGVGQRGSTYQHRSKALAQLEAQRLASIHPGIPFVVLAAVDAYRADTPVIQRIKITKPDPADTFGDDGIPF
ncbi:hypothetical protein GOA89_11425 [Sinorhizobium meliloti]|nr:hypothetical protein [Sinorhizobium meliloti]MDW9846913.1 hypothetical protein [Sinorhizobium meliloti]MDX0143717.1 hypothetical protein [Sinorhizobium meliloti]MDX0149742.1 hypothetical protein [Sinorhizobium meliloti]MDX0168983.1 hypothetical protein [Sinorhizobium meliloti]